MKEWRALASRGKLVGIILTTLAALLLAGLIYLTWRAATAVELFTAPIPPDAPAGSVPEVFEVHTGANFGTFGLALLCPALLLLVLYLAYQTYRAFNISYSLDRSAIRINTGDRTQVIPLAAIRYVVPASAVIRKLSGTPNASSPAVPVAKTSQPAEPPKQELSEEVEVVQAVAVEPEEIERQQAQQAAEAAQHDPANEVVNAEFTEVDKDDSASGPTASAADELVTDGIVNSSTLQPVGALSASSSLFSHWWGFYPQRAQSPQLGLVQMYATAPLNNTVLVRTNKLTYAISPENPTEFIKEYRLRRSLGAIEVVQEEVQRGRVLSHPLWHDPFGRTLLIIGVLLNVALFVFLLARINALPEIMQLHFNKFGKVDRIGERGELFRLPLLGLVAVVMNSLLGAYIHQREKVPAHLLYAGSIVVQIITAISVFVIIAISGA